jgi:ATP-dependent Lhr-like helicase
MPDADAVPAEYIAQGGQGKGAPMEIARAHHGSVSREQRLLIEEDLKSGRLRPSSPRRRSSWGSTWGPSTW